MPRKRLSRPECKYNVSGQARVYLNRQYFCLGEHDSPASLAKYFGLLKLYTENARRIPADHAKHLADCPITVRYLTPEFLDHIETKYANNATQRARSKNLYKTVDEKYADLPAAEFGPRKLVAIRHLLVASNWRGKYSTCLHSLRRWSAFNNTQVRDRLKSATCA